MSAFSKIHSMKIKDSDLLKLKVNIKTKNDTNFLELAILFDKPELLQILPQFRKEYSLEELVKLDKYTEAINALESKSGKINFLKVPKTKRADKVCQR